MNNAVAVMRVSSDRQGFESDSIEHQKDQIDLYASARNITIKKYFIFIESAAKEQQPVQEAIDYCKNPHNRIDFFLIKSIDRFTRGGSSLYDHMKSELIKNNVKLIDIYGVISNQSINTLEHLGVSYPWSVYNPSKKSELLEAERGHDELRDILSRMIGAEIRYTRLGYRVRQAPFGYKNKQIETIHGKRFILEPHPKESIWIQSLFKLKAEGIFSDQEIMRKLDAMGFQTRRHYFRDSKDRNRAIGIKNERPISLKIFDRIICNPIYAGITIEKWTNYKPIKCQFEGLVSVKLFNKANKGKVMIVGDKDTLEIVTEKQMGKRLAYTKMTELYPYKELILCPIGRHRYYGSSARKTFRSKLHFYPAYHCDIRNFKHYIRIPVNRFHHTVEDFLSEIRILPEAIDLVYQQLSQQTHNEQNNKLDELTALKLKIANMNLEMQLLVEKIKILHTHTAIAAIEQDIEKLQKEKYKLEEHLSALSEVETIPSDEKEVVKNNSLPASVVVDHNLIHRKSLFKLLFKELPTYEQIVKRTAYLRPQFAIAIPYIPPEQNL